MKPFILVRITVKPTQSRMNNMYIITFKGDKREISGHIIEFILTKTELNELFTNILDINQIEKIEITIKQFT